MALELANHYVISGKGIDAVIDTAGITGVPVVSLTVAGRTVTDPAVTTTSQGLVVEAVVDEVPDSHGGRPRGTSQRRVTLTCPRLAPRG